MSGSKKFGTFAGVFTPSILTILGVIMYMRLGWVVGNAGLWGTLIIILIAHVISITTGLSISSIATDKKVGPGGVYYVLSRSLGLPIGGAIGITLFVGTALSIALYLIGFAESFNAYVGFDTSINGLRITGSLALLSLMTIALISTSVALKTQFFIMAAIVLSIVSIFVGLGGQASPDSISTFGIEGGASMEMVFAIFFPAVTGFTAGIAMSGDLKNSKKSIPAGTIASIIVGFVVYVVLAIAIAYSIDSNVLATDNSILLAIAYSAPAVVAGIWGATLSSALGGILGGPRILQAMSIDKITPKIFGKGKGKANEPWNALILTVIIAQCGILIGELDLIARIVSMFYLAAYGFINISYFLESWASSDFNPTFKVKKWIAVVGFIASFAVMFKLDMLAMIAAFIVIGGIYFWLQRKQVSLGTGDIWNSVWNTVVQRGLRKLGTKDDHVRNWTPNILLFSGGTEQRPYLLEMSRAISGKSGMVTNFDLIENKESTILFPKNKQAVKDEMLEKYGIFGRRIEVQNVFKGIENIASTVGFSGIEPNSVVMGWAKNTKDPLWFTQMTQRLIDLDLNVIYLDYDKRFGFGNYKQIDIWWRDQDHTMELTLNIVKSLSINEAWRNAEIRILLVNNSIKEGVERRIYKKLDDYRINATVKIIHNAVEQKDIYDIMKIHSKGTDLIITGIPEINKGKEKDFVSDTNELFSVLGTCLLVKSSKQLGGENSDHKIVQSEENKEAFHLLKEEELEVVLPKQIELSQQVSSLEEKLKSAHEKVGKNELNSIQNNYLSLINHIEEIFIEKIDAFSNQNDLSVDPHLLKIDLLYQFNALLDNFIQEDLAYLSDRLKELIKGYLESIEQIKEELPGMIKFQITSDELIDLESDSKVEKRIKAIIRKKLVWTKTPTIKVPFKVISSHYLSNDIYEKFYHFENKLGVTTFVFQREIEQTFIESLATLNSVEFDRELFIKSVQEHLKQLRLNFVEHQHSLFSSLIRSGIEITNAISSEVSLISANHIAKSRKRRRNEKVDLLEKIKSFPNYWLINQTNITQQSKLDISLQETCQNLNSIALGIKNETRINMFDPSITIIEKTAINVSNIGELVQQENFSEACAVSLEFDNDIVLDELKLNDYMTRIQHLATQLPDHLEVMDEESINNFSFEQGQLINTFNVDVNFIVDYIVDTQVQHPLESTFLEIPQDCSRILDGLLHHLRVLRVSLESKLESQNDKKALNLVIQKTKEEVEKCSTELKDRITHYQFYMDDVFASTIGNLNSKQIIEQSESIGLASEKVKVKSNHLKVWWTEKRTKVYEQWAIFTHRINTQKDELFYPGLNVEKKGIENINKQILDYVEKCSPNKESLIDLPFYYQQLFTGKHSPKLDLLKYREQELEEGLVALNRIKNGTNGGILILGETLSGKTFFSEILAKEAHQNVYKIEAPIAGSTKSKDLIKALQRQIGSRNSTEDIILDAPKGSVFIFDDVELWWERNTPNSTAFKLLLKLIKKYGNQYIFIVNAHLSSFKLMHSQGNFDNLFVATIQMKSFNVVEMRQTILERHSSGGLHFEIDGIEEEELSELKLRRLMENYHTFSGGNIGVALHLWQANIQNIEKNRLEIISPITVGIPLENKKEWMIILAQFMLHKHLTPERLMSIFNYSSKVEAITVILNLERAGLIENMLGNTYRISPYLAGGVSKTLKEYNLI